jgi:putative phage-type endonuclease
MLSDEQLALRRTGITGTDIGAIMGINPWKRPVDVYGDKIGTSKPVDENEAMYWGNRMESVLFDECQRRDIDGEHGALTRNRHTHRHPDEDILLSTPDGFFTKKKKIVGIWEAKTSRSDWNNGIPPHYEMQVRWYMMVHDVQFGIISALFGGNKYQEFHILRDTTVEEEMKRAAHQFWMFNVEKKVAPSPADTFADLALINAPHLKESQFVCESDSMLEKYLSAYRGQNEALKGVKDDLDKLKVTIIKMTGGAAKIVDGSGNTMATYSNVQPKPVLNVKELESFYGKASIERFKTKKRSSYRLFRLSPQGGE